jgi:glycosyltransferase involved in cell wall biosynthesis
MLVPNSVPERAHTPVVILSASDWVDNAVSNMQIAAELSKTRKVLYVETMGARFPRPSEVGRVVQRLRSAFASGKSKKVSGLDPGEVTIFSPLAIPGVSGGFLGWVNKWMLSYQINRAMKRLEISDPIIWNFSPRWESIIKATERSFVVFHCVDALQYYDSTPSFKSSLERSVSTADLVLTPGILLQSELRKLNSNTHLVGHGCGLNHLNYEKNIEEDAEFDCIPKPIAIYAGALTNWIDLELFYDICIANPDVSFVTVGYTHALSDRSFIERLTRLQNFYQIGFRKYEYLPYYYEQASVGILPRAINNLHTQYCTPTKFLDYLAAGLPIVSTKFPAALHLRQFVKVASSNEEFSKFIREALVGRREEDRKSRKKYANENSWPRQVQKMDELIRDSAG